MHIRFPGEELERGEGRQALHASTSSDPSPASAAALFSCVASVRTDFNRGDQCYVLHLAQAPGQPLVAASLSNGRIKLFSVR